MIDDALGAPRSAAPRLVGVLLQGRLGGQHERRDAATCGEDIEVPGNEPNVAPSYWKHAKSAEPPIAAMSPFLIVAPSSPNRRRARWCPGGVEPRHAVLARAAGRADVDALAVATSSGEVVLLPTTPAPGAWAGATLPAGSGIQAFELAEAMIHAGCRGVGACRGSR